MPFFAGTILPTVLVGYQAAYPNVNVRLHDVVNENVIEETRSGRVEIGIGFHPGETDDLQFTKLFSEELIAVVPAAHSLAKKKKITWVELFDHPFLTLLQPASLQEYIKDVAKIVGVPFSPHIETHQLSTIGRMVSLGLGVGAIPKSCTGQVEAMGAVCLPLIKPVISNEVGIIHRRRYALSAAATAMKECIANHFGVVIE
jgi:LysR family carnitine catabolism transcriptional activator